MDELKLQTKIDIGKSCFSLNLKDKIVLLGSCFTDNIGSIMQALGLDVCVNPTGTLYNPVSICNTAARLSSGLPYSKDECVKMGAGSDLICSFSHHTSFARKTEEEFLDNANASLAKASEFWKQAQTVIITLGTAWCYSYSETGEIVSNCLKIDAKKFERTRLSISLTVQTLKSLIGRNPDKKFIFTVSPIRHLKDGAHGNQLSKSTLLLAVEELCRLFPERVSYFAAYEIMMDELRDYRFYAEDMLHPSSQAVDYIWKRFVDFAIPASSLPALESLEKSMRRNAHRPLH